MKMNHNDVYTRKDLQVVHTNFTTCGRGLKLTPFSYELTLLRYYLLDTIQDFLCKLGMKPHMHLVEISIFSLNHVITRPTKIIKDVCKAST